MTATTETKTKSPWLQGWRLLFLIAAAWMALGAFLTYGWAGWEKWNDGAGSSRRCKGDLDACADFYWDQQWEPGPGNW